MLPRLHASPASQGYKQLGNDSSAPLSPELSGHGVQCDGAQALSRSNTIPQAKSYGDLKGLPGRARGKKSRAMRWLVLRASGERQVFTLDKRQLIQTCRLEIPIRDMRLMDAALGTETLAQLLVRDNALVFSMEHVRLIIMHDKVVVPLDDSGQPPQPPAQPPAGPSDKDRFISHLEGIVMDWAVQHGASVFYGGVAAAAAGPPPHPSNTSTISPFVVAHTTSAGGVGLHPPAQGTALSHQHSHQHSQHPVSAAALAAASQAANAGGGGGGGGAGSHHASTASIAAQLEAHLLANSANTRGAAPRVPMQLQGQGSGPGTATGMGSTGAAGQPLPQGGGTGSETASQTAFDPEYQPFEMLVLETALSEICTHLSREVDSLQQNCQPALEALMKTADTANLEAVRRIKTHHSRLVTRVTATREALERLMEDDDDMMRMCLTQQAHMRLAAVAAAATAAQQQQQQQQQQHHSNHTSHHHSQQHSVTVPGGMPAPTAAATATAAAPGDQSPDSASSPTQMDAHHLAMLVGSSLTASYIRPASLAARAVRHQVAKKSGTLGEALAEAAAVAAAAAATTPVVGAGGGAGGAGAGGEVMDHDFLDVENLLESYAIIVDTTYQTLMSIGEYIDDTEDLINIQLDYSRNKLIRFDILLTSGTFALAFFNIVTGMLGENMVLPVSITQDLKGFILVNGGTLAFCITVFLSLVMVFKWQKVL